MTDTPEPNGEPGVEYLFIRQNFQGPARGGMFIRSMGMGRFIRDCEAKGYLIAAIVLDEGNNAQFLFVPPEGPPTPGEWRPVVIDENNPVTADELPPIDDPNAERIDPCADMADLYDDPDCEECEASAEVEDDLS